ncbi:unnamed protein product [Owenia fusiformis]|uniref:VPS9 domain-containing protein n=1 Tax=Owenia fusiformis TaxID=6347 RepID=A0A8S4N292_OWEFU|nr:unnamed protein product [Owenia fusiformis]
MAGGITGLVGVGLAFVFAGLPVLLPIAIGAGVAISSFIAKEIGALILSKGEEDKINSLLEKQKEAFDELKTKIKAQSAVIDSGDEGDNVTHTNIIPKTSLEQKRVSVPAMVAQTVTVLPAKISDITVHSIYAARAIRAGVVSGTEIGFKVMGTAGRAFHIGGGVLGTLALAWDIYSLVDAVKRLKNVASNSEALETIIGEMEQILRSTDQDILAIVATANKRDADVKKALDTWKECRLSTLNSLKELCANDSTDFDFKSNTELKGHIRSDCDAFDKLENLVMQMDLHECDLKRSAQGIATGLDIMEDLVRYQDNETIKTIIEETIVQWLRTLALTDAEIIEKIKNERNEAEMQTVLTEWKYCRRETIRVLKEVVKQKNSEEIRLKKDFENKVNSCLKKDNTALKTLEKRINGRVQDWGSNGLSVEGLASDVSELVVASTLISKSGKIPEVMKKILAETRELIKTSPYKAIGKVVESWETVMQLPDEDITRLLKVINQTKELDITDMMVTWRYYRGRTISCLEDIISRPESDNETEASITISRKQKQSMNKRFKDDWKASEALKKMIMGPRLKNLTNVDTRTPLILKADSISNDILPPAPLCLAVTIPDKNSLQFVLDTWKSAINFSDCELIETVIHEMNDETDNTALERCKASREKTIKSLAEIDCNDECQLVLSKQLERKINECLDADRCNFEALEKKLTGKFFHTGGGILGLESMSGGISTLITTTKLRFDEVVDDKTALDHIINDLRRDIPNDASDDTLKQMIVERCFGIFSDKTDYKCQEHFQHCRSRLGYTEDEAVDNEKVWENIDSILADGKDACYPQRPRSDGIGIKTYTDILAIQKYLSEAFTCPNHPLAQLLGDILEDFTSLYDGVGAHPRLMQHGVEEVNSYVVRIYHIVRVLFPYLPEESGCIELEDGTDEEAIMSDNERYLSAAMLLHPFLLPKLYPSTLQLCVLCNENDDKLYWDRIENWNAYGDIALLAQLKVKDQFWPLMMDTEAVEELQRNHGNNFWIVCKDQCCVQAVEIFRKISEESLPLGKLKVVNQAIEEINKSTQAVMSADDLIPLFYYVVVRARVRRLGAHIQWIEQFLESYHSLGKMGYTLTTLKACYYQINHETNKW